MGQRGPRPLPSNVHMLQGNRSKKSAAQLRDDISPDVVIPKCPGHLLPAAKREWKRVAPELQKLRIISELDMAALAAYCQAYARWAEAEQKIKDMGESGLVDTTPKGFQQMSVWMIISGRAVEQMHKFAREFGMTPSARSSVTPGGSGQSDLFGDDKPDPAAKFFGGNGT